MPALVQTCLQPWPQSVHGGSRHPLLLCLLVQPQLMQGPHYGIRGPAWALRSIAHACAWPNHTCYDSARTWRMNSVPIAWGPDTSMCDWRMDGVAMAAAHCSSTWGSQSC